MYKTRKRNIFVRNTFKEPKKIDCFNILSTIDDDYYEKYINEYIEFIDKCQDEKFLHDIYIALNNRFLVKFIRIFKYQEARQRSYARIVKPRFVLQYKRILRYKKLFSKKLLDVAIKHGEFNSVNFITDSMNKLDQEVFKKTWKRFTSNNFPLYGEIVLLQKEHIDEIFDRHKEVKGKPKLYSLSANQYFSDRHLDIALKFINVGSFNVNANNGGIPFKLSYLNKVENKRIRYNIIKRLVFFNIFKVSRSNTWNVYYDEKVKIEPDIGIDEINKILFPILMENYKMYENSLYAFGYKCKICNNGLRILGDGNMCNCRKGWEFSICNCRKGWELKQLLEKKRGM